MADPIGNPEELLRGAESRGEITFVTAVAEAMDRADALRQTGDSNTAIRYLQAVAALDIDDKVISIAVDAARRTLEDAGIPCEPSIKSEYNTYLSSLPPHDRHVMLARQFIRRMSSAGSSDDRDMLIRKIVDHFEQAVKHKPLGKKDHKIYLAMKAKIRA
jgi:hypothetical protein